MECNEPHPQEALQTAKGMFGQNCRGEAYLHDFFI